MNTNIKIVIISIIAILGLGIVFISSINSIPTLDEKVKAAWSQVENQYKRRFDLIPNLVNVVKGYAKHENETLNQVVEARSRAAQVRLDTNSLSDPAKIKAFQQAQTQLESALARLLVIVEKYPDLKANQNFLELQSQLEGTENRISVARRDYILAVQALNTTLRTFPGIIWAKLIYPSIGIKPNFAEEKVIHESPKTPF